MEQRSAIAKITGSGSFLPGQPVDSMQIAAVRPDLPIGLFEQYFGVKKRHWVIDLETRDHRRICIETGEMIALNTTEMAAQAALKAIAEAKLEANDIDTVVCNSTTPDTTLPTLSVVLQRRLKISQAQLFDVSGGCSASMQALNTAVMLIETGRARRVLVVSAECTSPVYLKALLATQNPQFADVVNGLLFADGASALVVESVEACQAVGKLGITIMHTKAKSCFPDRRSGFVLREKNGVTETSHDNTAIRHTLPLVMRESVRELRNAGHGFETLDVVIVPQVNQTMVTLGLLPELKGHKAKFCHYCDETGSVPAAAMFLALDHAKRRGSIAPRDKIGIISMETISWSYSVAVLTADEGLAI